MWDWYCLQGSNPWINRSASKWWKIEKGINPKDQTYIFLSSLSKIEDFNDPSDAIKPSPSSLWNPTTRILAYMDRNSEFLPVIGYYCVFSFLFHLWKFPAVNLGYRGGMPMGFRLRWLSRCEACLRGSFDAKGNSSYKRGIAEKIHFLG